MSKMNLTYDAGEDVYGIIVNLSDEYYNISETKFESYSVPNHHSGEYTYTMTDSDDGTYISVEDFPSLSADIYHVHYYIRKESGEEHSQDILIDVVITVWSGSAITDEDAEFLQLTAYINAHEAGHFFNNRLNVDIWTDASEDDKVRSLNMATVAIDKLNFAGAVTVEGQQLQFPRDGDTGYPQAIKDATCLCAIKFLDDWDADDLREESRISFQAYGSVKQSYKDGSLPYLMAGIPSSEAWDFLLPFLRQTGIIRIDRVS